MNRSVQGDIKKMRRDLQKAGAILPADWVTLTFSDGRVERYYGGEALSPTLTSGEVVKIEGNGVTTGLCRALAQLLKSNE